jgi:hypothetical protein
LKKVERDTYKCMAWLPLLGSLLIWKNVERDIYKCMAELPLLGLLMVWEKRRRETHTGVTFFKTNIKIK